MSVDAKRLAATLMDVVRAWIEPAFSAVAGRLEALERRPTPRDGKDAPAVDEAALVSRIIAQIPVPKDGRDGESVHPDTVRVMVADQVRLQLSEVPPPKDGHDGRDATAIDYRDGIDESKSYPKGTHALYHGGVIVALRATDPVQGDLTAAGWAVVLNGTHTEAEESIDDGRTIRRTRTFTNGKVVVSEQKTAIMLYRGVWKHDAEYSRGDMATWDGSVWHCEAETTKARPGSSPDWRLAVKRGNHGRDGKDGK